MSEGKDQEKTEQATPKRREDARKKGQVAHSKEISTVLILLSALGAFHFGGGWMMWSLATFMNGYFSNISEMSLQVSSIQNLTWTVAETFIFIVLPILAAVFVAGLAANLLQVGFHMTGEPLKPKLSKLNPLSGAKKLFSLRSLSELIKSILKIIIVGGTALIVVHTETADIPALLRMSVGDILLFIGQASQKIALFTCLVLILVSLADYLYHRWQFEKDLKMSKHEIKEEHKQQEGDPLVRARIRRIQTEMARHRMMEAVPEADVVITNPTHFAVALKYDAKEMFAPKVLAKGAGFIAQRIKEIAAEADIPIVENKPLARTLFRSVEIGDFIPAELFRAVAEILAYVYQLKRSR